MVELYDYQKKYLHNAPKNFIMAAGTGLGKSRMSLAHYDLHNKGGRLLIVAPAAKIRTGEWLHEISSALGADFTNFETLSYEKFTKRWKEFVDDTLTVILDEGHYIANASSKRSKAAQMVARVAKQFIILSATPTPNGWRSAGAYAIMFGLSRNKTAFERRFVIYDRTRTTFPLFLGYHEEDVLRDWWAKIAKPLERTGDLKLPSYTIPKRIQLSPRDLRAYMRVKNTRVYEDELLDSAPKLFAALRQMTTKHRLDTIKSILDGTDEHVLIFYNYNIERDELLKMLSDIDVKVYEQSGHASNLPKREEWATMEPSVTIGQYQSAATAIELTYATVVIFMSPTYSYSTFSQARGRSLRNGQEKTVLFYMLNVDGTIDDAVHKALKAKKNFDDKLYENY